jgi:hypothetical protein
MDVLSFFGFGTNVQVDFEFEGQEERKSVTIATEKGSQKLLVFTKEDKEIKGKVILKPAKPIEHLGIKLQFIGEIELIYDRGNHTDFLTAEKVLIGAGTLGEKTTEFPFEFTPSLDYESYNGLNARLRYYLKLTIERSLAATIVKEQEIWVVNYGEPEGADHSITMEVGIEECLHIEFEYERTKYHLQDYIRGKIHFRLVRLKIKYMELCLVRRESTGNPPNVYHENHNITKFEIMDGAPVKEEVIPVRLLLGAFPLTPTYKNLPQNKFNVKYFLNMVLVDEEDRRYFKQTEITLWRERPEIVSQSDKTFFQLDYVANFAEKKKKKKRKKGGATTEPDAEKHAADAEK